MMHFIAGGKSIPNCPATRLYARLYSGDLEGNLRKYVIPLFFENTEKM